MSFDVDHTVTGLGFQTYFVSQGSTYQISSNGREIEYIVAGAVRYRATTALPNFQCMGRLHQKFIKF